VNLRVLTFRLDSPSRRSLPIVFSPPLGSFGARRRRVSVAEHLAPRDLIGQGRADFEVVNIKHV